MSRTIRRADGPCDARRSPARPTCTIPTPAARAVAGAAMPLEWVAIRYTAQKSGSFKRAGGHRGLPAAGGALPMFGFREARKPKSTINAMVSVAPLDVGEADQTGRLELEAAM